MTSSATVTEASLLERYRTVRAATERLVAPLAPEDCVVQSMPDASPAKWHLAHTSWFFEAVVLRPAHPGYRPLNDDYQYLFNSYYNTLGTPFFRPHRGLVTRPTLAETLAYRRHVDRHMTELLERVDAPDVPADVITVGLHHEQQHQELIVTDVKHLLAQNPLRPVYRSRPPAPVVVRPRPPALEWIERDGGLFEIGHDGEGFSYDHETPRHQVFLYPFHLATRPVTCAEYLAFMADGGYATAELWLSDGWYAVQQESWRAPLYWEERDGEWWQFTLAGMQPVNPAEPVCHVSYYEADAYARWAGARLPREAEWETIAADRPVDGAFVEDERFHPAPAPNGAPGEPVQLYGDVWEWTQSPYVAYPGYRPPAGALGEYNAKFMANQYVLRGGSCATPRSHIRATYRNFFQPEKRWQFTGIRLAKDGE